jgi:hypothetical protein
VGKMQNFLLFKVDGKCIKPFVVERLNKLRKRKQAVQ